MPKYLPISADKFKEFKVKTLKGLWSKAKKAGYDGFCSDFYVKAESVNEEKATIEFVVSNEKEDRHGDVVVQNWDLKNFKKNPVFLNSHNYWDAAEAIGRFIKIMVDKKTKELIGTVEFAVNANPKAKIIFDLYVGGFLNAVSAGFIPLEFDNGKKIIKSELLEASAVTVPANADALAKSITKMYESNRKNTKDKKGKKPTAKTNKNSGGKKRKQKTKKTKITKRPKGNESNKSKGTEKKVNKQAIILNKIYSAVKSVSELKQVETPLSWVGAENKKIINRTIRELLKIKSK